METYFIPWNIKDKHFKVAASTVQAGWGKKQATYVWYVSCKYNHCFNDPNEPKNKFIYKWYSIYWPLTNYLTVVQTTICRDSRTNPCNASAETILPRRAISPMKLQNATSGDLAHLLQLKHYTCRNSYILIAISIFGKLRQWGIYYTCCFADGMLLWWSAGTNLLCLYNSATTDTCKSSSVNLYALEAWWSCYIFGMISTWDLNSLLHSSKSQIQSETPGCISYEFGSNKEVRF